jgi:uncharacterized membrane protein (DUF485 family)
VLVFLLYLFAIAFVASTTVLESGLDLSSTSSCKAAIYICIVFYVGSKVLVQTFLSERLHVIQSRLRRRRQDWLWLVSIAIIVLGFGTIALVAFLDPIAEVNIEDRKCRIGVPVKVTIPLIAYDIVLNVVLTAIFVMLLRPLLAFREDTTVIVESLHAEQDNTATKEMMNQATDSASSAPSSESIAELTTFAVPVMLRYINESNIRALKLLVYKSLGGAIAMLIPTVVNLGLLYRWKGEEQGWLCFTLCTVDGKDSISSDRSTDSADSTSDVVGYCCALPNC